MIYLIDISESYLLQLQDLTIKPSTVKVRTYNNIFLSFSLNQLLPRNSSLSLRFRGGRNNKNDWYYLQPYDPDMNGYITTNLNHYCHVLPILITGKDLLVHYRIIGEGIDAHQRITFEIKKTLVQSIVEENKKIEILVELPSERVVNLNPKLTINVISEDKDHFTIICPSTIKSKERFQALIRVEDQFYNLVKDFQGKFDVFKENRFSSELNLVGSYKFENSNGGILRISDLSFVNTGINYLVFDFNSVRYRSNPILCQDNKFKKRLFWGYIHGHTNKSDGIRGLKDYYQNMKNAGLDFGASTEHDHKWETTDEDFREIREIVEKNNQDERFVTLFGYEWGYWYTPGYGDICIYHKNNTIPILRSDTNKFNSTLKLIKNLSSFESEILMIGHHTALRPGYRNWTSFNGQLEKLVEIYSTWGNQEYSFKKGNPLPPRYKFFGYGPYAKKRGPILEKLGSFVQDALKRGYKLGFTAGGDDHYGIYPSGPINPDNGIYPSGIMAIWAEDLTRESIWYALNQRSCYGTTGPRVIIEFTLGKYSMGEIINLKDSKHLMNSRKIRLRIISPSRILKLELLRNNDIFKEKIIQEDNCELEYQDFDGFYKVANKTPHNEKFLFYYLRIFLEHDNMAWSSPIWVTST